MKKINMKKIITFSIISMVITILFSSCSSLPQVSVMKRHYNKGYYVSADVPKLIAKKSQSPEKKIVESQPQPTEQPIEKAEVVENNNSPLTPTTVTNEENKVSSENKIADKTPRKILKAKKAEVAKTIAFLKTQPKKNTSQAFAKNANQEVVAAAFSLLWILIVGLFILWLIAFLAGGWGLGGLIHILLVITLILLILWLLKVI
jgi:hypothetical protein